MKKKLKIAVTGGLGGGKSSFCKYIASKGYPVINADDISKEILVQNIEVKRKIIKNFGSEAYIHDKLNIKYLADKVFSNPSSVKKMNSIVHPVVIAESAVLMDKHLKKNKLVFLEAALIYEAGMEEMFDYIILVTADEEVRQSRAAKKGLDQAEFERRSANQIPDEKKKKKADFVFENNGSEEELKTKADMFLRIVTI
jgi:dephospho-CoA kinase